VYFEEEILSLIVSHYEGAYWDFKIQWPTTEGGSLLHDIICMANNLEDRDAYIIIGVKDKTCEIEGISPDDKNRKNTQQLNNYLKDKPFAGNIRPLTEVKEIILDGKFVDVIVIKRNINTPFYLTCSKGEYSNLRPYHIYTRIQDSNTDKNSSADLDKTEILWRKRFGLNLTALERFDVIIKEKDKWKKSPFIMNRTSYDEVWYHEIFPEFTIKISADESGKAQELYMAECNDPTPCWINICICYHNTVLRFFKGVCLDGGRTTIISPHAYACISKSIYGYPLMFHFFLKDSLEVHISNVLGGIGLNHNIMEIEGTALPIKSIVCFENQNEWDLFKEKYLEFRESYSEKLTDSDLKEISHQSIQSFLISPEAINKTMLEAHAKFTTWIQKKLAEFRKKI